MTGRRTRARDTFLALAVVVALATSVGSGLAIATIRHVEHGITHVQVGSTCTGSSCIRHVEPYCAQNICNYLILGSDSRQGLPSSFGSTTTVPGQRSDTIIVVQVDPVRRRTVVLSIPRDLRVAIPGHGEDKITTAFNYGPDTTVQAVEKLTGLNINHYVEVNFLGFEHVVDALGGVNICVDRAMTDPLSGLDLPHKGCYRMKGAQALAFVRARHVQGDVIPDFSRIARQQIFMRALISQVLSARALIHLPQLISSIEHNLVLDEHLTLYDVQDLTDKLNYEDAAKGVTFRVVPAVPIQVQGVDYVQLLQPQASLLFKRIRRGLSLGKLGLASLLTPISPANVQVQVLDANSGGKAARVQSYLQKAGFAVLPMEASPADLTTSSILWGPSKSPEKEVVSAYLPNLDLVFDRTHTSGGSIEIVVGSDFPGI